MIDYQKQWNYHGRSCSNIQGIIASMPEERWKDEIAKVPVIKREQVRDHLVGVFIQKRA